eukprot:scaffold4656_cov117-Isochrysis_galbana.AAC.2
MQDERAGALPLCVAGPWCPPVASRRVNAVPKCERCEGGEGATPISRCVCLPLSLARRSSRYHGRRNVANSRFLCVTCVMGAAGSRSA